MSVFNNVLFLFSTVTASAPINLALHRPAYQSSTYPNASASLAVDGKFDTDFKRESPCCAHGNDNESGPNWFAVDLERSYRIDRVVLTNRNCYERICAYRLDYFRVQVTNISPYDRAPDKGSTPNCGQYPNKASNGETLTQYCGLNTPSGRYVIIQQPTDGHGYLTICEIEVFEVLDAAHLQNQYIGCYEDKPQDHRDLKGAKLDFPGKLTIDLCIETCRNRLFTYAAVQYSRECYCGNRYGMYNKLQDHLCDMPCNGSRHQKCGGSYKNSIFTVCPKGLFGPNCTQNCHCSNGDECSFHEGKCQRGCSAGWRGPNCNNPDFSGGTFSKSNGTITSPNYPYPYAPHTDCLYRISVAHTTGVMITFSGTFYLETCCDYLKIDASNCNVSPTIYTITGKSLPSISTLWFPSCTTQITMQFHTDESNEGAGFSLDYTTGACKRTYSGAQGTISSPNHPYNYSSNVVCEYTIELNYNFAIVLTFSPTFWLESPHDYVRIDASSCRDGVITSFNGPTAPAPQSFWTCRKVRILFYTDGSVVGPGFSLNYTTGCEPTNFTGSHGTITSPNFTNSYPPNTNCFNTIVLASNTAISITFSSTFLLEFGHDYVEVDASRCHGGTVSRWTGSTVPATLSFSSCRQIGLHFHSDGSVQGSRFRLDYATGGCGPTNFLETRGTLSSPNFPSPYLPNTNCFYTIDPLYNNTKIGLNFSRTFDIRSCCDYLRVDGSNCLKGSIYIFNGSTAPDITLLYSCRQILIEFFSDGSGEGAGFSFDYTIEDMDECESREWNSCDGATEDCNDTIGGYECICTSGFLRTNTSDKCISNITSTYAGVSGDVVRWVGISIGSGLFVVIVMVIIVVCKRSKRSKQGRGERAADEHNAYVMDDGRLADVHNNDSTDMTNEEAFYENAPPRQINGKTSEIDYRSNFSHGVNISPSNDVKRTSDVCVKGNAMHNDMDDTENFYESLDEDLSLENMYMNL